MKQNCQLLRTLNYLVARERINIQAIIPLTKRKYREMIQKQIHKNQMICALINLSRTKTVEHIYTITTIYQHRVTTTQLGITIKIVLLIRRPLVLV